MQNVFLVYAQTILEENGIFVQFQCELISERLCIETTAFPEEWGEEK